MSRLKWAVVGAALLSAACGAATITEHISTPLTVRTVVIATAEPGSPTARSGSFIAEPGTALRKVGVSRAQGPAAPPAQVPAKQQPPATLPALPSNPCGQIGKSGAMCPVAST